jgi:hypothetical protein
MLKGEVETQFTTDHFCSTASSVSSATGGWRPALSALSSMHEPPPQPIAPSRLGVPKSEVQFIAGGVMFQPIIVLNRTPVAGETSLGHSKTP